MIEEKVGRENKNKKREKWQFHFVNFYAACRKKIRKSHKMRVSKFQKKIKFQKKSY